MKVVAHGETLQLGRDLDPNDPLTIVKGLAAVLVSRNPSQPLLGLDLMLTGFQETNLGMRADLFMTILRNMGIVMSATEVCVPCLSRARCLRRLSGLLLSACFCACTGLLLHLLASICVSLHLPVPRAPH